MAPLKVSVPDPTLVTTLEAEPLVARDAAGKPFTVRYDEVNAMLLNEFLKEHRKVEAQGQEIAELKAALREQAAQLQKVNELAQARVASSRLVENGR